MIMLLQINDDDGDDEDDGDDDEGLYRCRSGVKNSSACRPTC